MRSMTGYGRASKKDKFGEIVVECSSVNRRQLEVVMQLPKDLLVLEARIREVVTAELERGRVVVSVTYQPAGETISHRIHRESAEAAHADLVRIKKHLGLKGEITLDQVMRHPGFYEVPVSLSDPGKILPNLLVVLAIALGDLQSMRQKEGLNLGKDLQGHLRKLKSNISGMRKLAAKAPLRRKASMEKRIAALPERVTLDPGRLASEVALLADRSDISEELARIESHLTQFAETLDKEGAVGRTLEFLAQELHRELNTSGAKAADADIARFVVDAKGTLEKIREQILNFE